MKITCENIIDVILKKLKITEEHIPENFRTILKLISNTDKNFEIDRERLNIMLSYWHISPMNSEFFNHYFKNDSILEIEQLESAVDQFIKDALWHFGSLERAYEFLSKEKNIEEFFKRHEFDTDEFKNRLPWNLVETIEPTDRGFLGYVSGQKTREENKKINDAEIIIDLVIEEMKQNDKENKNMDTDKSVEKILDKLSSKSPAIGEKIENLKKLSKEKNLDLFSFTNLEDTKIKIKKLKEEIEKTINKIEELKNIGKRNQEHYLRNIESIDVYIATSMRNDKEYIDMYNFVNTVFNDEDIKNLNLRYFDPTLCFCKSRIDKGIIECLLVRSSKVTIYCAQEGDTFGKDSELAATMAQGKPVIVYVPRVSKNDKKYKDLETRAKTFKEYHPLSLQVGLYDGVARGLIVVRTPEECSKVLYKILTNSLKTKICYEEDGIVLRDMETDSVLRIMTGWDVLASCFWNQFDKTQNPKAGLTI